MLSEHLEKLRYFSKLVHYRSLSEAAEAMHISQAGLSKSIAALENVLGVKLLKRSQTGVLLTKEGEMTLVAARKIMAEASHLETSLRAVNATPLPEKLRIGMYDSIAVYLFSEVDDYLRRIYTEVQMELYVNTSQQLLRALRAGALDLCIGVNLDLDLWAKGHFFQLFDDRYAFYMAPRLDGSEATAPLLIHPAARDRGGIPLEKHLASLLSQRTVHRVFNFETLKTLAVQGLGIAILPTRVAQPLISLRQLQEVPMPRYKRAFGQHRIGFLAAKSFLARHQEFAQDLYRIGHIWTRA